MPFKSESQRKFMWAKHPEIARKWTAEGNGKVVPEPSKAVEKFAKKLAKGK